MQVNRFENLVREVGEEGREIDYVKLDVELSEIDFLQDMLYNSPHVLTKIKQIAMEVHDGYFTKGVYSFYLSFILMLLPGTIIIRMIIINNSIKKKCGFKCEYM